MAKFQNFEEYFKTLDTKDKKNAAEFVENYTTLLAENSTRSFKIGESPMPIKEALTTKDASVLVTKVVEGALEQAAEPVYIGSKLFDQVSIDTGNRIIFPALGELVAEEMAEGDEYRNQSADINLKEKVTEVSVTKKGIMVPITEEMIQDSLWSVVSLHLKAAGRAMARLKEEKCFKAMRKHGHVIFDNELRDKIPEAGTTGLDEMGEYNNTLAVEDIYDTVIGLLVNGYNPTDVLIHPLSWMVFARNGLIDAFDKPALGGDTKLGNIDTNAANGNLPVSMNIISSPFIPLDKENKRFDMYVIDRNNIGSIVTREDMTTDQFEDPYRDIMNLKIKERYGIGVYDSGKAITLARNISMAETYAKPQLIRTIKVADKTI